MDSLNPDYLTSMKTACPKWSAFGKTRDRRRAEAEPCDLPEEAWSKLAKDGFTTKKGGIFGVAITAGTMALKKTSGTIPFCHAIPIEGSSAPLHG